MYANRHEIERAYREGQPPALGFLLVFGAAALGALAVAGDIATVAGVCIPLLWFATAYALRGPGFAKSMAVPLTLLLFAVPPPSFILNSVLVDLKLLVTASAVSLLHFFGSSVAAQGTTIHVPAGSLFVADACSGLSSVVTLLPLAVIVAHFLSHGTWRRLLIVASVVPLALGGNIVRVVVTVWLANRQGIESAEGLMHDSFGMTTYVVGTLTLLAVARGLR